MEVHSCFVCINTAERAPACKMVRPIAFNRCPTNLLQYNIKTQDL